MSEADKFHGASEDDFTCREEGHVEGCSGAAGGDHEVK